MSERPAASTSLRIVVGLGESARVDEIRRELEQDEHLEIIGQARTAAELVELCRAATPTAVLLDPELEAADRELAVLLRSVIPGAAVIVLVDPAAAREHEIPVQATVYWAARGGDVAKSLLEISAIAELLGRQSADEAQSG